MKRISYWLPAVAVASLIFWLSSRTSLPPVGPAFPHLDKIEHAMIYALLGGWIIWALRRGHGLALPKVLVLAMLLTSAYGASDEIHQRYVPPRTCEVWDWLADTAGGALAAAAFLIYESRRRQKKNQ